MKFTRIPAETFNQLQANAGILLNKFDPTGVQPVQEEDFISATTGGTTATAVPTFSDLGDGIDNAPLNAKELKHLDSWECTMSATLLNATPETIKLSLGSADYDLATGKITPRNSLKQTDFVDLWWVGDMTNGGAIAVRLMNALNTSGFSLTTTDRGKGEFALEATGHFSLSDQDKVPMEFYLMEPESVEEISMAMGSVDLTNVIDKGNAKDDMEYKGI